MSGFVYLSTIYYVITPFWRGGEHVENAYLPTILTQNS